MNFCSQCDKESQGAFCTHCGRRLEQMEAVKRDITILFSDLQNSTSLGVDYSLEASARFISVYHELMRKAVHAAGGHIAQIGGDDFVAYFGYPANASFNPQDAVVKAVEAALAAIRGARILNMEGSLPLPIRIGIHQGPAVLFESSNRDIQFGGTTPIVAARLQSHARANSVVVSQAAAERIENRVELNMLGSLNLKGLPEPVVAYEVTRVLSQNKGATSLDQQSPFVGREEALQWLQQRQIDRTPISVVIGEPGIGKTRLVETFVRADEHEWLHVRCAEATQSRPLEFFYRIVDTLAPGEETHVERLRRLAPEAAGNDDIRAVFEGHAQPNELMLTQRLAALLHELLRASERSLWIDDLQWMDAVSHAAVIGSATLATEGVRIIGTARPEMAQGDYAAFELTPLTPAQTQGLAATINAASDNSVVAEYLHKMTNGNPLYIEQLMMAITDDGLLDNDVTDLESLSLTVLPPTLTELLVSRIDTLGTSKQLLQTCSLLGDTFDLSMVQQVGSKEEAVLRPQFNELEQRFLLQQVDTQTWEFRHGLIREAASVTMLAEERQTIHGNIARVMENSYSDTFPGIIASHWERAGQTQLAISAYTQAAEELLGRSLHQDALNHCEKALTLLEMHPSSNWRDETRYELLVLQGNTLSVLENYGSEKRLQVSEATLELADKIGRYGSELIPILYGRWTVHLARSDIQTRDWAERLVMIAGQNPSMPLPQIDVTSNFVLGVTLFMEGQISDSIDHFKAALALYDQTQHVQLMRLYGEDHGLYSSVWLQWAYVHAGRIHDARKQCQFSDKLADKFDDPMSTMLAMTYKMHVHIELRELDEVIAITGQILDLVEQNGLQYYKLIAEGSRSRALMLAGRLEEAQEDYLRGNRYAPEYFLLLVTINRDFVNRFLQTGELEAAKEEVAEARKALQNRFERNYEPEFHFLEGEILNKQGNVHEAIEAYKNCYSMALARGAYYFAVKAGAALAQLDTKNNSGIQVTDWRQYVEPGVCRLYEEAREIALTAK